MSEPDTTHAKMTMKIYLKGGKIREKKFEVFSRKNIKNGVDGTLMVFKKPTKIKLLTHSVKNGEDLQWIKLTTGKPKKTAKIGKEKSFVGSNFCYEDLSPRKIDDYKYTYLRDEKIVLSDVRKISADCYVVKGVRKKGDVVYDKAEVFIKKSNYFPVRINLYRRGELFKVLENYDIKKIKGINTPLRVVMYKVDGKIKTPLSNIKIRTELIVEKGFPKYNIPRSKVKLQYFKSKAM